MQRIASRSNALDLASFPIILDSNNKLGEGSYGETFRVKSPYSQEFWVCKIIQLGNRNQNSPLSSHHLLRLTFREVVYLQKCNQLIGYHYDQDKKEMILLTKYISGKTELQYGNSLELQYASFCALRSLHRQHIAHMDPHESNFIYNTKTKQAAIIDFGLAQDHHFFRECYDYYLFLKRRHEEIPFSLRLTLTSIHQLLSFYFHELKAYVLLNRYKTAASLLFYVALLAAACSGVGTLGTVSLIAQEYIRGWILQKFSEFLEVLQDYCETRAINRRRSEQRRYHYYAQCAVLIMAQGLLLIFQLSQLYYHLQIVFSLFPSLSYSGIWQTLIQLSFFRHTYTYWKNNAEKYFLSNTALIQTYQNKIEQNASYLPLFQQRNRLQTCLSTSPPTLLTSFNISREKPQRTNTQRKMIRPK